MIDDDYNIDHHLEAEGISGDVEGPKVPMTDGGESLDDMGEDEGRLSRIRNNISGKYNVASEAAPESPLAWLGATALGGWGVNETREEGWESFHDVPEYLNLAADDTAMAAEYLGDAGIDALYAAGNFGEAAAVGTAALLTAGAAGKTIQTYRQRNDEE